MATPDCDTWMHKRVMLGSTTRSFTSRYPPTSRHASETFTPKFGSPGPHTTPEYDSWQVPTVVAFPICITAPACTTNLPCSSMPALRPYRRCEPQRAIRPDSLVSKTRVPSQSENGRTWCCYAQIL